jgi:hypothetical protein
MLHAVTVVVPANVQHYSECIHLIVPRETKESPQQEVS